MNEAQATLLDRIVCEQPDRQAWRLLVDACRADHRQYADLALTNLLGNKLSRVDRERRASVFAAVADTLANSDVNGLAALLASADEESARHLALELAARWRGPLPNDLVQGLRGLFLDRRLPEEAQLQAAATLLRFLGPNAEEAEAYLRTLVSGLGKVRSIERLRRLERHVGKLSLIDRLCEGLEDRLRLSCPRCQIEMRRPEMQRHLWEAHKLLLIGLRVREPWALIEEWIDVLKSGGPAILSERCRNLAQQVDPDKGLRQLNRLILRKGIDDAEALQSMLEEASEQHASLCPRCLALLPVARDVPPWPLSVRRGRVSARGYVVDVSERGVWTRLEVRTPARIVYRGREPSYVLSPRGAIFAFAGPFVGMALVCAVLGVKFAGSALSPVILLLSLATLSYGCILWDLRGRPSLRQRAISYAWSILAPRLLQEGYRSEDASLLAALASLDDGDNHAPIRSRVLPNTIRTLEEAMARGEGAPQHLATVCLRMVADDVAKGRSPEDRIAELIARAWDGKVPLSFVDPLLEGWRRQWRTPGGQARLRILICDRAFEAGFELHPLFDACQTAPSLCEVMNIGQPYELAALRLLWSLRATRPWDQCGPALTTFDLAADPGNADSLAAMPDLLFYPNDPAWPMVRGPHGRRTRFRMAIRACGLMIQDQLFAEAPEPIRTKGRIDTSDLMIGAATFQSTETLENVADCVKKWSAYFFTQFRPRLDDVMQWKSPAKVALLRAWGAVNCPDCGKPSLPRKGALAVAATAGEMVG